YTNARMTFYEVGVSACGFTNKDTDHIVAINTVQWAGGAHCSASITIIYHGKSAQAKIVDKCTGCPYPGLDLSPALFSYLAGDLGVGAFQGDWYYN
ncbi:RlpA-like double-psi beta-barrel-protein domain-containing protein-containing protein, partial [Trametes elegans]